MFESFEFYLQRKMRLLLLKPFKYWRAFQLGIIDEHGNKLREPAEGTEKQIYNVFDELIRRIKFTFYKYVPNKGIIRYKVFKSFLEDGFIEALDEEIYRSQTVTEEKFQCVESSISIWLSNHKF